jgi:hypothetical protein
VNAHIVPARLEDAFVLSTAMREADVRELAACGQAPLDGLLFAMKDSRESFAMLYDDEVGAMFGVRPLPELGGKRRGELWFLTGHLFGQKPIAFVREARRALEALMESYDELVNLIDTRYGQALRFAVAMGAQLGAETPIGPERIPFVVFRIGRA